MTDAKDNPKFPVFSGTIQEYPSFCLKLSSGLYMLAPEVLAATSEQIELLKGQDYDTVPASETAAEKVLRLKNKKIQLANARAWHCILSCIDATTTKGQVAELKVLKHQWDDNSGNS